MRYLVVGAALGMVAALAVPHGPPFSAPMPTEVPTAVLAATDETACKSAEASPTCVHGVPVRDAKWDIDYALASPPGNAGSGFEIAPVWFDAHNVGKEVLLTL